MKKNQICNYCGKPTMKVLGDAIYPHRRDLWQKKFLLCKPCEAYVGCHENTDWKPYGRLANKELREWKVKAHTAFDVVWKKRYMSRKLAYQWLADQLGIDETLCHIGYFDADLCKQVVDVMEEKSFLFP